MNYPLGLIVVDSYGKIEGEYFAHVGGRHGLGCEEKTFKGREDEAEEVVWLWLAVTARRLLPI